MTEYDHEIELTVRFRDMDTMGHVNNAVYSTYLEQARVEFIREVVGGDTLDIGAVLADLHVEFERPIEYGERVVVGTGVGELGTSSIPVEHVIEADGHRAASAQALMVTYDSEAGQARPIPEDWRERIRAHESR